MLTFEPGAEHPCCYPPARKCYPPLHRPPRKLSLRKVRIHYRDLGIALGPLLLPLPSVVELPYMQICKFANGKTARMKHTRLPQQMGLLSPDRYLNEL